MKDNLNEMPKKLSGEIDELVEMTHQSINELIQSIARSAEIMHKGASHTGSATKMLKTLLMTAAAYEQAYQLFNFMQNISQNFQYGQENANKLFKTVKSAVYSDGQPIDTKEYTVVQEFDDIYSAMEAFARELKNL